MKISSRLTLSLGLIVLVILGLLIISITGAIRSRENMENIYNHPFKVSTATLEVEVNILKMQRAMKDITLAETQEDIEKALETVRLHEKQVGQHLEIIRERFLGDKTKVKELEDLIKGLGLIRQEVIDLVNAGENDKAIAALEGKGAIHVEKIETFLDEFTTFAGGKAEEFHDASLTSSKLTLIRLYILSIISILLVVILPIRITRKIIKPLNRLTSSAKAIGSGKRDIQTKIHSNDEMGDLSRAFDDMAKRLSEFESSRLKKAKKRGTLLEKEVEEKNEQLNIRIKEMEATRLATLNMMEDVDDAYKSLQKEVKLKDELFNITSHELKSPLVPILGYIDLMKTGKITGTLNKDQKEALTVISRNATRLSNLIEDVLDIARLQAKKMKFNFKRGPISEPLKEVETGFKAAADKQGVSLILDIDKNIPRILLDKTRMVQVFSNLVNNSLKFTDKGAISIHAKKEGEHIIIDVADTGVGMKRDDLNKIFEKFYQVEASLTRKHGGSGLGLAIVKGIVEEHGGKISVRSKVGKGTVFTITIPINKPEEEQKRKVNIPKTLKELKEKTKKDLLPEEEIAEFFS